MTESPPPFAPVPTRARHDGWTAERQHRFVAALGHTGVVAAAARHVGMSTKSAYALRRRAGEDSAFARAWDAAVADREGEAIAIGMDRAIDGEMVPVFYRGRRVGQRRRHDDRVLLATLRAVAVRGRYPKASRAGAPAPVTDDPERLAALLCGLAEPS